MGSPAAFPPALTRHFDSGGRSVTSNDDGDHSVRFAPSDDVRQSFDDGVLTVTIDRPEKRNPLSLGVLEALRQVFGSMAADPQIRLAVVTGAGDKAFASGGDLDELSRYRSQEDAEAFSLHGKA